MIFTDGNFLLHLSTIVYIVSFLLTYLSLNPATYFQERHLKFASYGRCCAMMGGGILLLSFLVLVRAYIISDFSVVNVVMNSSSIMPWYYKFAGVWGNHEGSMLLLCLYFGLAGVFFCIITGDSDLARKAILIQVSLQVFIILFIIFTSNPFTKIFPRPKMGLGLNPVLQDSGLVIHPPILYLGYAGCAIIYSIMVAKCNIINSSKAWLYILRPWVFASWGILTLGIGLGSWWAYKEIGWGGFWFWDPVENISLFPWIFLTGLSHSVLVSIRSRSMHSMTILFGISAFLSILLGIWIVRAGILQSIHAFASSPERGVVLLCIFLAYTGYAMWSFSNIITFKKFKKISDTTNLIRWGNYLLLITFGTIALGTFYPLFYEIFYDKKTVVDAPYFDITTNTTIFIILVLCYVATAKIIKKQKIISIIITVIISLFPLYCFALHKFSKNISYCDVLAILGTFLSVQMLVKTIPNFSKKPWMILGHCSFAVAILSVSICSLGSITKQQLITVGDNIKFLSFDIQFEDISHTQRDNYFAKTAIFKVNNHILTPELRIFPIEKQMIVEPSILRTIFYDLNFSITQINKQEEASVLLSIYYRPMLNWLWAAIVVLSFTAIIISVRYLVVDMSKQL